MENQELFAAFVLFSVIKAFILTAGIYTLPIIIYRKIVLKHELDKTKALRVTFFYGIIAYAVMVAILISMGASKTSSSAIFIWSYINYRILRKPNKFQKATGIIETTQNEGCAEAESEQIQEPQHEDVPNVESKECTDDNPCIAVPDKTNICVHSTEEAVAKDHPLDTNILMDEPPRNKETISGVKSDISNNRQCPFCGKELKSGSKFCSSCGKPIPEVSINEVIYCHKCGFKLIPGSRYCSKCGTNIENKG